MRKFLWIILLIVFQSCLKNDHAVFEISMPQEKLSFKAIPGGAVMYYDLPEGKDVMSIVVRYQDAWGNEIIRTGSYACDSLVLPGFSEARQGVSAKVTLCDRNNRESIPLEVAFDTKDSGAIAFFNTLEVKPNWNGFLITYDAPVQANGIAHVFYIGENLLTKEVDTLLINSFIIKGGRDTLSFVLKQLKSKNNIVIRTEDFQGHIVKQKVWEGVESYFSMKYAPSNIEFEDLGLSNEKEEYCLSYKYLFDGDLKGEGCFGASEKEIKTYLAGPGAVGKPLFILDLQREKKIASINIYGMLYFNRMWPNYNDPLYGSLFYNSKYHLPVFYPCCVTVEASINKNEWKTIATYKEEQLFNEGSWAYIADRKYIKTVEQLISTDPIYISINIPSFLPNYRYLRLTVDKIFDYSQLSPTVANYNKHEFVMMHEIEVYVNKD